VEESDGGMSTTFKLVRETARGARNYFTTEIILDLWLLCRRCECQRLQRLQAVECMMKSFFETSKPFVAVVSSKTGACGQSLL
jgi:hypothetical protein